MRASLLIISAVVSLGASHAGHAQHDNHDGPTMNFHRIDDSLATGGHVVGDGLDDLEAQGISVVVDLRDEPPGGQEKRLAARDMQWVNVPVVWRSPKLKDYEKFRDAMNAAEGESVLVQCQANYRASAFTYLYRVLEQDVPEAEARKSMNLVWEPEGTWAEFIDEVKATYGD